MAEESVEPWAGCLWDFQITGARVVATLGYDGGAIVENAPVLYCSEGRLYTMEGRDDDYLHQLEYYFSFNCHDEAEPYPSQSVEGRIVVTGRHSNGYRVEIRGDGWIGYDDKGNVTGRFDRPPVMITEDSMPDEEAETSEEDTWLPTAEIFNFPMPPQFTQATVRVPIDDDLE